MPLFFATSDNFGLLNGYCVKSFLYFKLQSDFLFANDRFTLGLSAGDLKLDFGLY